MVGRNVSYWIAQQGARRSTRGYIVYVPLICSLFVDALVSGGMIYRLLIYDTKRNAGGWNSLFNDLSYVRTYRRYVYTLCEFIVVLHVRGTRYDILEFHRSLVSTATCDMFLYTPTASPCRDCLSSCTFFMTLKAWFRVGYGATQVRNILKQKAHR